MSIGDGYEIETVRGRVDDALTGELLRFWAREAGFTGDAARARVPEVVCVLRRGGGLAGVGSAFDTRVPLVAGRRFWVMRHLLPGPALEQRPALTAAVFAALDAEYDGDPEAPGGLCVLVEAAERRRRPQAEWSDPRLLHAGYLPDGRQVRVAYFAAELSASPTPPRDASGWLPGQGYRIERADGADFDSEPLMELWTGEALLAPEEAERRRSELLLVALDEHGAPVGASTTYLRRNDQLGGEFWYFRTFVAAAHRRSSVAVALALTGRDLLIERFRAGDPRGLGVLYEVENPDLKTYLGRGRWSPADFSFVGENEIGAHVRVHYFPGVHAPEPEDAG